MAASYVSADLLAVWLLLIATVIATFFLQRHRVTALPPAAVAMILGTATGVALRAAGLAHSLSFSADGFFYGLLPPIILAAGLTIRKRAFFSHIAPITVFAIAGTLISTLAIGLATYVLMRLHLVKRAHLGPHPLTECFLFGAALSATDTVATLAVLAHAPVPPVLAHIIAGESVLNDAVAVVLFRTLAESYHKPFRLLTSPFTMAARFAFVLAGSTALGAAVAMGCAFVLKRFELDPTAGAGGGGEREGLAPGGGSDGWEPATARPHQHGPPPSSTNNALAFTEPTVYEITLVLCGAYLAYLAAEVAGLSGIVALFAAGVAFSHYAFHSVTPDARTALVGATSTAAFLSEAFIFAYLGIQVPLQAGRAGIDWGLLLVVCPLMMAARGAAVFPLSRALNARPAAMPLPTSIQRVLALAGLRGAVAYALILRLPSVPGESLRGIPAFEAAILLAACVSTLAIGPAVRPALAATGLLGASDADVAVAGLVEVRGVPPGVAADRVAEQGARGWAGSSGAADAWQAWDDRVLKPVFGGRANVAGGGGSGGMASDLPRASAAGGGGGSGGMAADLPRASVPPPPPPPAIPELEPLSAAALDSRLYVPPDPFAPQG